MNSRKSQFESKLSSGDRELPQYPTSNFISASGSNGSDTEQRSAVGQDVFVRFLCLERKRSERSGKPFVLMLIEGGQRFEACDRNSTAARIAEALLASTRDTDLVGWYKTGSTLAVLFTEISDTPSAAVNVLLEKFTKVVGEVVPLDQSSRISISMHVFPEPPGGDSTRKADLTFYPDVTRSMESDAPSSIIKRLIDLAGSMFALLLLAPVFLVLAIAIKLTSKGPVFFRQTRVGQYGRNFTLFKFRSMYADCDHQIHKEYVTRLIAGDNITHTDHKGKAVFKLTKDSRITPLGHILRRTSLDEIPQFINVLFGEMSLVGPRPAMPYEVERYETWHRRRMLSAKPGITGLWQVSGRSRTSFDDMVRLDLRYVEQCSIALDLKILLQTPRAVFFGAY